MNVDASDDQSLRQVAFLAGMHDLGKATPCFQSQNDLMKSELASAGFDFPAGKAVMHARATQLTLPEAVGVDVLGSSLSGVLGSACMLGGHHGTFPILEAVELHASRRSSLTAFNPTLGKGDWGSVRSQLVELVADATGTDPTKTPIEGTGLVVGAGLVVISDWLASQDVFIRSPESWPDWEHVDWQTYFKDRAEEAVEHIRSAGLMPFRHEARSFSEVFGFAPRPLQESLEDHFSQDNTAGGILVATAPMGVGKTEAALRAASHMGGDDSGVLFLLPTMATANAMFGRVADYAESSSSTQFTEVGLVHSMAGLHEQFLALPDPNWVHISDDDDVDGARAVSSRWLRGRQKTLLAPVAAATIDQLLAATLKARRSYLRWLGVTGKVVIIDEAHSFDAYMNGLLCLALQWLGRFGVPVVIMSATMPTRVTCELVEAWCKGAGVDPPDVRCPYPGWLHVNETGVTSAAVESPDIILSIRSIEVADWNKNWILAAQQRLTPVETEGCALVVCNTVAEAQQLTRALTPWADEHGVDLTCLHSRFLNGDRAAITEEVLKKFGPDGRCRPKRAVLVATQIVEQSLDVDFDLVISALAPIAPLLQRSGRGHRHNRPRPAKLATPALDVLVPVNDEGLSIPRAWQFVYPPTYFQRTWLHALQRGTRTDIHLPDDVQGIVDAVYGDLDDIDDDVITQMDAEWVQKYANPSSRIPAPDALSSLSAMSAEEDEQLILATRLGIDSVPLLCVWRHDNTRTLDRDGLTPLPSGEPTKNEVRAILGNVVNLRRTRSLTEALQGLPVSPPEWGNSPYLNDLIILEFDPVSEKLALGDIIFSLSDTMGVQQERIR
jgi:CRISPR-associated endonuclease/helicase Cas3